jgi:hypothetical protein
MSSSVAIVVPPIERVIPGRLLPARGPVHFRRDIPSYAGNIREIFAPSGRLIVEYTSNIIILSRVMAAYLTRGERL